MHIYYTPEYGWSWLPTLLGRKEIKAVHDLLGDAGVYYLLAHALPIAPQSYEMEDDKREVLVLEEIKDRKVGGGKKKDKFPAGFYKDALYIAAVPAVRQMGCIPNWNNIHEMERRKFIWESQLSPAAYDKDPEKRAKDLAADEKAFKLINATRAEIRIEESHLNKMVSRTGLISLDEFFE